MDAGADARAGRGIGAGFEFRIDCIRFDGLDRFAEMVVVVGQRTGEAGAAGEKDQRQTDAAALLNRLTEIQ